MKEILPDESRRDRHVEHGAQVGVINVRSKSIPRGRYYGQPEWAAWTRRRVANALNGFDSHEDFVEFAIVAAHERALESPNHKASQANKAWDVERIVHLLEDLLRGTNSGTRTLQFFNTGVDAYEGIPAERSGAPTTMPGYEAVMKEDETDEPPFVEPDIIVTPGPEESTVEWREEVLARYVNVLIDAVEAVYDIEIADRIEKILL